MSAHRLGGLALATQLALAAACGSRPGAPAEDAPDGSPPPPPVPTQPSPAPSAGPLPRIDAAQRGSGVVGAEAVPAFDALTPEALATLRRARVVFGHQSVGQNVIEGAARLGFPFRSVDDELDLAAPIRGESLVAENHEPKRKVRSFSTLVLERGLGAHADVAGFKLCWVDFYEPSATEGLEADYERAVDTIRAKLPELRIFHVTPPLATREPAENRRRLAFGAWLVATYAPRDVVFDLGAVESTRPDGTRCEEGGVPALCADYAADEGHLNERGSERAAKALLVALARSLGAR